MQCNKYIVNQRNKYTFGGGEGELNNMFGKWGKGIEEQTIDRERERETTTRIRIIKNNNNICAALLTMNRTSRVGGVGGDAPLAPAPVQVLVQCGMWREWQVEGVERVGGGEWRIVEGVCCTPHPTTPTAQPVVALLTAITNRGRRTPHGGGANERSYSRLFYLY